MKTAAFKDFVKLQRGFDLPRQNRKNGSVPVVGATQIQGYHNQSKVSAPGVTTGRSGALGDVLYLSEDFWPLNTSLWVKDFKNNNPRYVYYKLKTLDLKRFNSGAGVPTLNRNHLDTLSIEIHEEKYQQKIAEILGAYDDLIENNSKRIEKVEAMARLLYRHYFEVPEAGFFELQSICDTPRESVSAKNLVVGTNYIGLEHIPRKSFGFKEIGKIDKELSLKIKFQVGDILFGKIRPYFHKVAPAPVAGVTSSDTIVIRPQSEHYGLVLMTVSSNDFVSSSMQSSNGTKMPRANWDVLKKYKVPKIDHAREFEFNQQILTIVHLIRNLTLRNESLANARDLLLPRLMSGEIEV